jgi:hypothetical protein
MEKINPEAAKAAVRREQFLLGQRLFVFALLFGILAIGFAIQHFGQ